MWGNKKISSQGASEWYTYWISHLFTRKNQFFIDFKFVLEKKLDKVW